MADVFGRGGEGAIALAELVAAAASRPSPPLKSLYESSDPAEQKIQAIATQIYGADGVDFTDVAREQLNEFRRLGFGQLPICMAKTQDSLSDNPKLTGRPQGFRITVREFEIANGAGFLVALTGKMVRMPALPKMPAAERIRVNERGDVVVW